MGKSSSPPASPDYQSLIPLQSKANLDVFNTMLGASRVNSSNPYGTSTWNKTPTFDQAGYDAALSKYNTTPQSDGMFGRLGSPAGSGTPAPSKDQFTTYDWTNNQSFSPGQQQLYDKTLSSQNQQADLLQGLGNNTAASVSQPINFGGAPALNTNVTPSTFQTPTFANGVQPGALPTDVGNADAYGNRANGLDTRATDLYSGLGNPRQYSQEAADAQYNASTRYLLPQQQQQQQQMESRLAEQGFVQGTPAFDQAMQQLRSSQSTALADARDRATLQGATVGNQWFGNDLSGRQFGATEQGQNFARDLSGRQFGATNDQADFARRQGVVQALAGLQGQKFGQDVTGANLQRSQTQDANDNAARLFGQQQSSATFGNQARNQYLSELLTQRQYPLNELNAFRSGTQVTNPNLQAQYSTPNLQGVDMIGAAQQDYQNQLGAYNAQVGSDNSILGLLGGLGGAALLGPMGAGLGGLFSGLGGAGQVTGGTGLRRPGG